MYVYTMRREETILTPSNQETQEGDRSIVLTRADADIELCLWSSFQIRECVPGGTAKLVLSYGIVLVTVVNP